MDPRDCLAVHDGETTVMGLDGTVSVIRDRWGIPHIRAGTAHDAFFAQGFCMAQDRAWQIELIRHMAHGRAAGLLTRPRWPGAHPPDRWIVCRISVLVCPWMR